MSGQVTKTMNTHEGDCDADLLGTDVTLPDVAQIQGDAEVDEDVLESLMDDLDLCMTSSSTDEQPAPVTKVSPADINQLVEEAHKDVHVVEDIVDQLSPATQEEEHATQSKASPQNPVEFVLSDIQTKLAQLMDEMSSLRAEQQRLAMYAQLNFSSGQGSSPECAQDIADKLALLDASRFV